MNNTVATKSAQINSNCDTMNRRPANDRSVNGLSEGPDNILLKVIFWNAGGLTTDKFTELKASIFKEDIDVFGIVEAGASTENLHLFQIPGYQVFSLPRARQTAAGIIVGAKTSLVVNFNILKEMSESDKLEAIQLDVWKDKVYRCIMVAYNPPANKPNLAWLEARWNSKAIFYGDLNAPSKRWNYSRTTAVGQIFEDFVDANPVEVIDNEEGDHTFISYSGYSGHPDLIFAHSSLKSEIRHTLMHAPGDFGHKIMKVVLHRGTERTKETKKATWNLKKAKWNLYSNLCDELLTEEKIQGNVDVAYRNIRGTILKCACQAIPKGRVKKYSPFWNQRLQELKQERDRAREAFEGSRSEEHKMGLRNAAAKLKSEIAEAKKTCYGQFLERLDFRKDGVKAHRFLSRLDGQRKPTKNNPVMTQSGKTLSSNLEIAKYFCSHYSKISNFHPRQKDQNSFKKQLPTCFTEWENNLFRSDFKLAELELALEKMPNKKCAGPDEILPEFITNLGVKARDVILKFLNKVWRNGFPSEWRKADIVPIPKAGKTSNTPQNYRPIALTSMFSKLYERMLLERLEQYLEGQKIISDRQAGFRKCRNTVEHVAYLAQEIKNAFNRKQSVVAVFVDLKAAFDKVWRERLLQKLRDMGIAGNMYSSIHSFLAQRLIRVRYNDAVSPFKQSKQGVPQGSVLSPSLFNLMINDVVTALEAIPGVRTLLYADDLVVWATSSRVQAVESCLNEALEKLQQWVFENELEVNTRKTKFQVFTLSTKRQNIVLKYNNDILPQTDSATYLGIRLDNKLGWMKHVEKLVQQGEKRLNLLKRLAGIRWGAKQDLLSLAYKTYIRPAIEYGGEVLLTAPKSTVKALDIVQNKALRLVTGAAKSTPVPALEIQTGTEPLELRREKAAVHLYERVKRLNVEHWNCQEEAVQRLKTQIPFSVKVKEVVDQLKIKLGSRQQIQATSFLYENMAESYLNLLQPVVKELIPQWELRALALETINKRYPSHNWLHIYTDGSAHDANTNAGAGVYSTKFELSAAVGSNGTNFDGEVKAILMALRELEGSVSSNLVLMVDSQAAISAVVNRQTSDNATLEEAKNRIDSLIAKGNRVVLQWVPSHCGLHGNERADELAKKGAKELQPDAPLPLSSAKRIVANTFKGEARKRHEMQAEGKQWKCLLDEPIPQTLKRNEAVACFRMATGHDYLQKHLNRIGVVESPICPLCQQEEMDALHLHRCPVLTSVVSDDTLTKYNKLSKLYWAARSQMSRISGRGVR